MKRLFTLLLAALMLAGCGKQGDYTPTGDGLTIDETEEGVVIPTTQNGEQQDLTMPCYVDVTMNPLQCTDYTNRAFISLLYQGLFAVSREYAVEPMLCGKYSMAGDMKSYVFYVDEAARFSDGSVVRAADVAATLREARKSSYYGGRFLHVTSISETEDGGVCIELDTACENLPILLDIPIIKESELEAQHPVGTGAYILDSTGKEWLLRRNTNWWCKAQLPINTPTIVLAKAYSNQQIRDDFQFSELNLVCADPCTDRYTDYRCDYELWGCESGVFTYIAFSDMSNVFENAQLRAALTYAIDRDRLSESIYRGFGKSATLPASPNSPYYNKGLAERYGYDPEKFQQALQDSGKEGKQIVFLVNSDDSLRVRAARQVADQLTQCGLVVVMKELSGKAYTSAIEKREFDLYMGQTKLSANMDLSAFFMPSGKLSLGGVANSSTYNLCLQALENHGNYYTLHQQIMDQGRLCPVLFCSQALYASRGVVTGLSPARDNLFWYSIGKTMEKAFIRE